MTSADVRLNRPAAYRDMVDGEETLGLLGTHNSLAYRVHEIERHVHSGARWFGAAAIPTATHLADRIGPSIAAFTIDAGNNAWGAWVQILGSDDTPAVAGKAYFDPHQMVISDNELAAIYFLQFGRGASGAAALAAGNYTELVFDMTAKAGGVINGIQTGRAPAGSLLWARCLSPLANTAWLKFYIGIHEYEG